MKRVTELSIEYVAIDAVEPHPDNARLHTSGKLVAESLDTHGQYRALVVQRSTGHILAGNGTWRQLQARGDERVAVTYLDVGDEQAKRILLVDNATSDESGYDEEALAELLLEMEGDYTGTGFTQRTADQITELMAGAMTVDELVEELGNEPDPAAFWPVARVPLPHDLYSWWIELVARNDGDAVQAMRQLRDATS